MQVSLRINRTTLGVDNANTGRLTIVLCTILGRGGGAGNETELRALIGSNEPLAIFSIGRDSLGRFIRRTGQCNILCYTIQGPGKDDSKLMSIVMGRRSTPEVGHVMSEFRFTSIARTTGVGARVRQAHTRGTGTKGSRGRRGGPRGMRARRRGRKRTRPRGSCPRGSGRSRLVSRLFKRPIGGRNGRRGPSLTGAAGSHLSRPASGGRRGATRNASGLCTPRGPRGPSIEGRLQRVRGTEGGRTRQHRREGSPIEGRNGGSQGRVHRRRPRRGQGPEGKGREWVL